MEDNNGETERDCRLHFHQLPKINCSAIEFQVRSSSRCNLVSKTSSTNATTSHQSTSARPGNPHVRCCKSIRCYLDDNIIIRVLPASTHLDLPICLIRANHSLSSQFTTFKQHSGRGEEVNSQLVTGGAINLAVILWKLRK